MSTNIYPLGYWWDKQRLDQILEDRKTMTLAKIAQKHEVCKEYIRLLEHRAKNWNTPRIQAQANYIFELINRERKRPVQPDYRIQL